MLLHITGTELFTKATVNLNALELDISLSYSLPLPPTMTELFLYSEELSGRFFFFPPPYDLYINNIKQENLF